MATPIIEARSLSSLTALASNPPAYPRNPTHERHEPLVLYIARVPGSRGTAVKMSSSDVGLTCFRCLLISDEAEGKGGNCRRHTELTLFRPR